jgi:hypothetical protein
MNAPCRLLRKLNAWLGPLVVVGLVATPWLVDRGAAQVPAALAATAGSFGQYVVRLAEPQVLLIADAQPSALEARVHQQQRDAVAAELDALAAKALAGAYAYDDARRTFTAELTAAGRDQLLADQNVAGVDLVPAFTPPTPTATALPAAATRGAQSVSSVNFIQVYTPFMWGRVSVNGLSVQLTLEDGVGSLKGVAYQITKSASVAIDPTQLYYETVFYDAATQSHTVTIQPGDRVHVVTSGVDPGTGLFATEDKRITVDDVRAWTSYQQDSVSGVAPAGSPIVVTVASSLSLNGYLTPGTSAYADNVVADGAGSFTAAMFHTSPSAPYAKVDMKQTSNGTGFVRVVHPNRDEVYTVHGQNAFVLENSSVMHGYAFALPAAPGGLASGVAVPRPAPNVSITLRDAQNAVKATATSSGGAPYSVSFNATISGGDAVEVSINGGPVNRVTAAPITATVDLTANQVTGTGPAGAQIVVDVGRINGYVVRTDTTTFNFLEKIAPADASGAFATGAISCGGGGSLNLRPGSFGYAGFEDGHGNFVYMDFAAPVAYVMSDFPFLEGWVADGTGRPAITQRDADGNVKHQGTATPWTFFTSDRHFINVYYNNDPSHYAPTTPVQFFQPGDVVSIAANGRTATIPVDKVTAFLNSDANAVAGEAPAGSSLRVVPLSDRSSRRELVVDGSGTYSAGQPFKVFGVNCVDSDSTKDFKPGESGRAYVRHADGNEVFAGYARAMHVNEHDSYNQLFLAPSRGLDWTTNPPGAVVATLTPRQGTPVTGAIVPGGSVDCPTNGLTITTNNPLTCVVYKDGSGAKVQIRGGDSIAVSFAEGIGSTTRPTAVAMSTLALLTASPDTDTSTVGGVGPRAWGGRGTMNAPMTGATAPPITANRSYTAYPPLSFTNNNASVPLVQGYSGQVSFSDNSGHRLFTAWAVTAFPVKITNLLGVGSTLVCVKAPPNSTVRVHDVTDETQDVVIGTGTTDGQGRVCVTVTPLYGGEVVIAEAEGTFSQPVVIYPFRVDGPIIPKSPFSL